MSTTVDFIPEGDDDREDMGVIEWNQELRFDGSVEADYAMEEDEVLPLAERQSVMERFTVQEL